MTATGDHLLDQFQLLHPEPNIFRLGQYAPVSIRDQVVRGCYLLERLWATGQLAANTRLLIVGAGVAGVTAALRAIHYGVQQVTIADSSDRVLSLQAGCASRWVDPAQYDWPARHWEDEEWPIAEPATLAWPTATSITAPVPLKAGYADDWAADFDLVMQSYLAAGSAVFLPLAKVTGWLPTGPGYQVQITDVTTGMPAPSLPADLIIFAGGLGAEICSVHLRGATPGASYSSLPFWSTDAFETTDFGLGRPVVDGVLISGAGDGALQDFIRFVTGQKSARDVWRAVEPALSPGLLRQCEALWHWEELASRSETFAPSHRSRCERLAALHARYRHVIDELAADAGSWAAAIAALDQLLQPGRPLDQIQLALKADHFDGCYPLNRLVALLCVAYLERAHGLQPLLTFHAVRNVAPQHGGSGWGVPVSAELAVNTSCATTAAELETWTGPVVQLLFDGVVIRHGIDPGTLSIKSAGLGLQQVPAHLP